uniref:VWFC domain-containing protein n=1 Tax=Anopheles christyi TaxID=43041 RepID=A0A182KEQ0_9DIPT
MNVPTHFMEVEQHFRNSIDLDAEQTEARYDQEMLSDIINDNDRGELQKAESCLVDDYKYDHGQKIQRLDPCEICLCIDGEIFCWWKQCDALAKTGDESDPQIGSPQQAPNSDQPSTELSSEASTVTNTAYEAKSKPSFDAESPEDNSNGATRLTLSDSLSDGGTTAISSTLPISTPSSRAPDGEHSSSETVTHHGTVHTTDVLDGIPKNILSFPQTPPIMMYRPVSTGPIASTTAREGKYSADGGHKGKLATVAGVRKGKGSVVGHKKLKDHKKNLLKGKYDGGYSYDFDRKPTVSIASDALPKVSEIDESSRDGDKFHDQSGEEVQRNSPDQEQTTLEQQQFGGYGFGMIHEPESEHRQATVPMRTHDRDVPQHYIITSSGHVEMFDDSGTLGGPENGPENHGEGLEKQPYRDVLSFDGRVSSRVSQDHPQGDDEGSDVTDSDEGDDEGEHLDDAGAIAPAIMLTTNVTQGKYSLGEALLSTQLPPSPSSVIDILNSTTLETTDYVDGMNHSELIYPEVPSISSSDGGSSSSSTTKPTTKPDQSEQHCVVMGVTYPVGAVLKQETGNCLQCVCVAGPENDPAPRVTCTPLNCPPLILPDILDGAGF